MCMDNYRIEYVSKRPTSSSSASVHVLEIQASFSRSLYLFYEPFTCTLPSVGLGAGRTKSNNGKRTHSNTRSHKADENKCPWCRSVSKSICNALFLTSGIVSKENLENPANKDNQSTIDHVH
jgi:hypothetical protein